jgi:hypothetical protein
MRLHVRHSENRSRHIDDLQQYPGNGAAGWPDTQTVRRIGFTEGNEKPGVRATM